MLLNVRRGKSGARGLREGSDLAAGNTCDGVGVVNPRIYETGNEAAEEASGKSAKVAGGEGSHVSTCDRYPGRGRVN